MGVVAAEIVSELNQATLFRIVVKREVPELIEVTLEDPRDLVTALSMECVVSPSFGNYLLVKGMKENASSQFETNDPKQPIIKGDRIVSVGGQGGDQAAKLLELLTKGDSKCKVAVERRR